MSAFDMELADAPKSSSTSYVLPWDSSAQNFSAAQCDPILSDNVITEYQLGQLIEELKKNPYYKKKKVSKGVWILFAIFLISVVLFIILEKAISITSDSSLSWRILLSLIIFFSFGLVLWHYCIVSRFNSRRTEKLKVALKQIESKDFAPLKASLVISNQGSYIQIFFLWKAYRKVEIKEHGFASSDFQQELGREEDLDPEKGPLKSALQGQDRTPNMVTTAELPSYHQPALLGDSSPPPVHNSPKVTAAAYIIPTRDIQIQYSPESRAQDVRDIARDKLRN